MLIPYRPSDAGVTHRLQYRTDILKSRNGVEHRIALAEAPRESYDFTLTLTERELRALKVGLFNDPAGPHLVPAFHEEALVRGAWSGVYITIVQRNIDWMTVGQAVLVTNQRDEYLDTEIVALTAVGVNQRRTAAFTGSWDSGASSVNTVSGDCVLSCTGHTETGSAMIGLSFDDPDRNYTSVDYAIAVDGAGNLAAYENGVFKGSSSYASGDDFSVTRTGTLIQYRKNGVEFYNSLAPSTGTLRVDTALFSASVAIYGIQLFDDGTEVDIVWQNVTGVTNYNLELADSVPGGETYAAGVSTVVPIFEGYLEDRAPLARNQNDLDDNHWQMRFRRSTFSATQGTGATVANYDGMPLFDRRPLNNELVQENLVAALEEHDAGGAIEYSTELSAPDVARMHSFFYNSAAERQWYKAFLYAVKGRQKPFLMSTGRMDLALSDDFVDGLQEYINVEAPPTEGAVDYVTDWWPHEGFRRLAIRYTTGAVDYRTVTAAVDNLDGTATLTVAGLSGGYIESVSFLETCRLAQDEVQLAITDDARFTLGVVTVQDAVTGPYYPSTGDDVEIQTALDLTNLWLFQETSGSVIDQMGNNDLLVAIGTPGFGYQPVVGGRRGISYAAGQSHQASIGFGLTTTLIGAVVDFSSCIDQTQLFGNFTAGGYAMFYMASSTTVAFRILSSTLQVLHLSLGIPVKDNTPYLLLGRVNRTGNVADAICCRLDSPVLSGSGSVVAFTNIPETSFGPGSYGTGGTHLYYAFRARGAAVESLSLTSIARSLGYHV